MFTEVATEDLLREVRGHDFGADPVHEFGAREEVEARIGLALTGLNLTRT